MVLVSGANKARSYQYDLATGEVWRERRGNDLLTGGVCVSWQRDRRLIWVIEELAPSSHSMIALYHRQEMSRSL